MISYPLRVLFIEDDLKQAEVLAKLLRKRIAPANLEVFFAPTLEQGVRASHALIPCIVFLDLVFPGLNDWHATAKAIPDIRGSVVVVTEMDNEEVEMECRANGALDVFSKSKIRGIIEILVHVVTNIRLNNLARETMAAKAT